MLASVRRHYSSGSAAELRLLLILWLTGYPKYRNWSDEMVNKQQVRQEGESYQHYLERLETAGELKDYQVDQLAGIRAHPRMRELLEKQEQGAIVRGSDEDVELYAWLECPWSERGREISRKRVKDPDCWLPGIENLEWSAILNAGSSATAAEVEQLKQQYVQEWLDDGQTMEDLTRQEPPWRPGGVRLPDGCQLCLGQKRGIPGNENVVCGVRVCDYCSVQVDRAIESALQKGDLPEAQRLIASKS